MAESLRLVKNTLSVLIFLASHTTKLNDFRNVRANLTLKILVLVWRRRLVCTLSGASAGKRRSWRVVIKQESTETCTHPHYVIVHTILPPSPVILWIELGDTPKWLLLNFGFHDVRSRLLSLCAQWGERERRTITFLVLILAMESKKEDAQEALFRGVCWFCSSPVLGTILGQKTDFYFWFLVLGEKGENVDELRDVCCPITPPPPPPPSKEGRENQERAHPTNQEQNKTPQTRQRNT